MSSLLNVPAIPLALYIHIPWCVKKCPYCDFNSHTLPSNDENNSAKQSKLEPDYFEAYVTALIADINAQLPLVQNRVIGSIFIGGGTPSLLPIKQYQRLFEHLRQVLAFADDIEITMEANPGTLEHAPFEQYLEVGINRLSIGVQSFNDTKLAALGRIHNAEQAAMATQAAKKAGFERINIDLMHGLPQQTVDEALHDIKMAHQAGATHISWYQLTIEPNTVFYRNTPVLPDDDNLADIEEQGSALLTALGYQNYEVSAWVSASDKPCRHNINYWQFGDYLAIGAGAHGKVSIGADITHELAKLLKDEDAYQKDGSDTTSIYRFSKTRLPKDYVSYEQSPKMVGFGPIDTDEITSEYMLNVLRINEGVPLGLFSERTGLEVNVIQPVLETLIKQGLLEDKSGWLQPTPLGRRYLNQILQAFL